MSIDDISGSSTIENGRGADVETGGHSVRPPQIEVLSIAEAKAALDRAASGSGEHETIIVDFDETLWLRNTTEEYLASLRPRLLAHAILLLVDLVRPWIVVRTADARRLYRDWIRVLACSVLMPWSLPAWRRRSEELAERWKNRTLIAWLEHERRLPLTVATLGVDALVEPILRHIDPSAKLIAAGSLWSGHRIRIEGKHEWIERRHVGLVSKAIVITDSEHDADLLSRARTPILVKWPEAEYRQAFSDAYLPFLYTQKAKRPGENYMLYGVGLEDIVHLWLAFVWLMPSPVIGGLALLVLHLAFWAVYELGYVENDVLAVKNEARPKIFAEASAYVGRVKPIQAWIVALVLSAPALGVLVAYEPRSLVLAGQDLHGTTLFLAIYALWVVYLALQRASFWIYNRLDVRLRGLFYVVLQLVRLSGYALFLRVNLVGAVLLMSLVLARWVKYLAYRDTGRTLAESQRLLMLAFFVVLVCGTFAVDPLGFLSLQAAAAFAWLALYSHRRLRELARDAKLFSA